MSSIASGSTDSLEITVVIPAFNEARNISTVLEGLCAQTLRKQKFEVIVVDNGSTDSTVAEVSRFAEQLPLRVVTRSNCRISAVRNFGASLAKGRVLAFLDADCLPPARWLEEALSLGSPRDIWGAHYLIPKNSTWVGKVWFEYQATAQQGPVSFLPGGCLFIPRAAFEQIGGFGENLETSEDVELCARARQYGMAVLAFPQVAVYHGGTAQTLQQFYRQNRWHGTTVLRIFFANLPSTANLPLVALSLYTLLMFWAAILGFLFGLFSHPFGLAVAFPILLCLPACLLSFGKAFGTGRWADAPKLCILYMTYLLARAASVTQLSKRNHR